MCDIVERDTRIPVIGYGTGVVRKYSRNIPLYIKSNVRPLLSSIKHGKLDRKLQMDLKADEIVKKAQMAGYRMFDTARIYGYSERAIGRNITPQNRKEFFLVTKVSDMDLDRAGSPGDVAGNLEISLKELNTSYVDAYLLHYPHGEWKKIYCEMEEQYWLGRAKMIGVCNFNNMEVWNELMEISTVKPQFCQLEIHPLNAKREMRQYCRTNQIQIMAHTPTGHMCEKIRKNATLQEISRKYRRTLVQVILRWHYQNGIIPIISTLSGLHMAENLEFMNFSIETDDMQKIEGLDEGYTVLKSGQIDDPNYIYNR